MIRIPITKGYFAVVDECDADRVLAHRWRAMVRPNTVYVARSLPWTDDGRRPCELLHRFILQAPSHLVVDHADRDGLNNTRANLRLCTMEQNIQNSKPRRDNRQGLKGVHFNKKIDRYYATIFASGRSIYLGSFATAEAANDAYRAAALKYFGPFARAA